MASLAFTAYGVHWWAIGMARVFGGDPRGDDRRSQRSSSANDLSE
jgi:hypothetical protein